MKKCLFCWVMLLLAAAQIYAEPLLLEQANNVLAEKTLEIGIQDIVYRQDITKMTNSADAVLWQMTQTMYEVPFYARYAVNPLIEGRLYAPYADFHKEIKADDIKSTQDISGFADPQIALKVSPIRDKLLLSVIINLSVPVGEEDFRQGYNTDSIFALRKSIGKLNLNSNISYSLKPEYTDQFDVKQDPGDVLLGGIGAELPINAKKTLHIISEFIYRNISKSSVADVSQKNSSGSQIDIDCGIRFNIGAFKTKLGAVFALGDEQYRTYDYMAVAGITYLIKI